MLKIIIKNSMFLSFVAIALIISACSTSSIKETNTDFKNNSPQTFLISEGVEITMVAPLGFNITKEHYGFAQPESFSRIKIEEKEYAYDLYIKSLSKENLLNNQIQLIKKEATEVNGARGMLFVMRQNIAGTYFEKLWVIVGDNLSCIQVEASYPEGASETHKKAIKKSLLDFSVATDQSQRLFTGLPFKLTGTASFKVKQRFANSVVLLPNDETQPTNVQSVVISHGAIKQPVDSIQLLSEHFLKNNQHYKNVIITNNEMIKIDKIPALATIATAEFKNESILVYQVVSYQKERFLLVQGQIKRDKSDTFVERVNDLLTSFKFK